MERRSYRVESSVDIEAATSPEDAARQAVAQLRRGDLDHAVLVIRPGVSRSVATVVTLPHDALPDATGDSC